VAAENPQLTRRRRRHRQVPAAPPPGAGMATPHRPAPVDHQTIRSHTGRKAKKKKKKKKKKGLAANDIGAAFS